MYQHTWHRSISSILEQLPAKTLVDYKCYFGGGTALVLQASQGNWPFGAEYRLSDDIDFLCTNNEFLAIRRLYAEKGIKALIGDDLKLARTERVDQYGIRAAIISPDSGDKIKFEIICDATLQSHTPQDVVHGITCLSLADSTANKLMANANRWADRTTALRDYIDLIAIGSFHRGIPAEGWKVALSSFGSESIHSTLCKSHELLCSEGYLERCINTLKLAPKAVECLELFIKSNSDEALAQLLHGLKLPESDT